MQILFIEALNQTSQNRIALNQMMQSKNKACITKCRKEGLNFVDPLCCAILSHWAP